MKACLQIYVSSSCFSSYVFLTSCNFSLNSMKRRKVSKFENIQVSITVLKLKDMLTRFSTRRMFWSRTRLWSLSFFLWMAVVIIWIWSLNNTINFIHNDANKYFSTLMVPPNKLPYRSRAGTFPVMFFRFFRVFFVLWMMMLTFML